jgi:hypothetical protein
MCRAHLKHPMIESELMFAYATTDNLASLQELISSPNIGQIQEVGDRFSFFVFKLFVFIFTQIYKLGVSRVAFSVQPNYYSIPFPTILDFARLLSAWRIGRVQLKQRERLVVLEHGKKLILLVLMLESFD